MGLTSYLSLLIAVTVIGQVYSSYVVLAPNKFYPDWDYTVQVTVDGMSPGSTTTVQGSILDHKNVQVSSVTPASIVISQNGVPQKLTLQIPGDIDVGGSYKLQVTGTGGREFTNTTEVEVAALRYLTFIQTDKKIYKAGQLVRFRVITVNKDLEPQKKAMYATIKNPAGSVLTRIDIDGTKDVFEDTYQLTAFPDLGIWTIRVASEDNLILEDMEFKVDEYVLPKFEVNVQTSPESLYAVDEKNSRIQVLFDAKYTYGLDVAGDYVVTVTSSVDSRPWRITGVTKSGDKTMVEVDLSEGFKDWALSQYYEITVEVTDETQRSYQATTKVPLVRNAVKMEFDEARTDMVFRPGMPINAVVKITDNDGKPLRGKYLEYPIKLKLNNWDNGKEILEEVNLSSGQVEVAWTATDNASFVDSYQLSASMTIPDRSPYQVDRSIQRYRTLGNATLNLRWTAVDSSMLKMGFDMSFRVDVSDPSHFSSLTYMVVSRANIQTFGNMEAGQATTVKVTTDMCPNGKLVAYGVTSVSSVSAEPELIADSLDLKLEHCQKKRVIPSVSMDRQKTGTNTNISVTVAWTDSSMPATSIGEHTVHVLAVDKSIIMLEGSNDLTPKEVDKRLGEFNLEEKKASGIDFHRPMFDVGGQSPPSTGQLLKSMGLTVMADAVIKESPEIPPFFGGGGPVFANAFPEAAFGNGMMLKNDVAADGGGAAVAAPVVTVRKNFPDTWLWKSGMTDTSGLLTMNEKTPDSITAWVISAFAVRDGSDMAVTTRPYELNVYNEFFITMNLPYSIRRTEKIEIRITAFNYSPVRQDVNVVLAKSPDFLILGEMSQSVTVDSNGAGSVTFKIAANKVGTIALSATANSDGSPGGNPSFSDTVTRMLPVKPEGVMRMRAETFPLFVPDVGEDPIDFDFTLALPPVLIVPDSRRALVKITGNLMGNIMSNLDNLLQVPFGCGEQNMMSTIPNIVIVEYYTSVGELTKELNNEAMENIKLGYNKETQQYRHDFWAYSAFGKSDGNASTWLTAFVVRSFAQARKFYPTIVDKTVLENDTEFLFSRQIGNQFVEYGKVLHKEMQGGGASGKALSVYVAVCLLEAKKYGIDMDQAKLNKAIDMVNEVAAEKRQRNETFLAAITAYAVSLQELPKIGTVENLIGFVEENGAPWNKTIKAPEGDEHKDLYFMHRSGPSDVEITSYCLLTYCQLKKVAEGRKLALWLQSQQNADGGFSSTQDTAVALQAIACYASLFSQGGENEQAEVTVTSLDPPATFKPVVVDASTSKMLQIVNLPDETNKVNIKVSGTKGTLAVVKVVWYFYTRAGEGEGREKVIDRPIPKPLTTEVVRMRAGVQKVRNCFPGNMQYDNMMLMTLDLPSGMEVSAEEQKNIKGKNKDVRRVEQDKDRLYIYYDSEPTGCLDVIMDETVKVENPKEGNSMLYAYYEPGYGVEAPIPVMAEVRCVGQKCTSFAPNQVTISGFLMAACICFVLSLLLAM